MSESPKHFNRETTPSVVEQWKVFFDKYQPEALHNIQQALKETIEKKERGGSPEQGMTIEGAPRLRCVKEVGGGSLQKVFEKYAANGAGQVEWNWILAHPEEAATMLPKDGGHYFFPNKGRAEKMIWNNQNKKFLPETNMRIDETNPVDWIVLVDR